MFTGKTSESRGLRSGSTRRNGPRSSTQISLKDPLPRNDLTKFSEWSDWTTTFNSQSKMRVLIYLLLALMVFGSGLDTSVGLNFLILFLVCSTLAVFLDQEVKPAIVPMSVFAMPSLMFLACYCVLVISEFATTGTLDSGLRVAVNFAPVGILLPTVILTLKNGVTFHSMSRILAAVAVLYAFLAGYEVWVLNGERARFGYNPIPLGMIAVQFLFWSCVASYKDHSSNIFYCIGIIAAFWVVFLTGSRMPILVAGLVLMVWLLLGKARNRERMMVLGGAILVFPLQKLFNPEAYSSLIDRLGSLLWWLDSGSTLATAKSSSGIHRMEIWRIAWEMIKDKPAFGWGSRQALTQDILSRYDAPEFADTYPHFHNEILDLAVRFGGLGSFAAVLAYASILGIAKTREQHVIVAFFLLQLFALSLTDIIFAHSVTLSMFVYSFLMMSLLISSEKRAGSDIQKQGQ